MGLRGSVAECRPWSDSGPAPIVTATGGGVFSKYSNLVRIDGDLRDVIIPGNEYRIDISGGTDGYSCYVNEHVLAFNWVTLGPDQSITFTAQLTPEDYSDGTILKAYEDGEVDYGSISVEIWEVI